MSVVEIKHKKISYRTRVAVLSFANKPTVKAASSSFGLCYRTLALATHCDCVPLLLNAGVHGRRHKIFFRY